MEEGARRRRAACSSRTRGEESSGLRVGDDAGTGRPGSAGPRPSRARDYFFKFAESKKNHKK